MRKKSLFIIAAVLYWHMALCVESGLCSTSCEDECALRGGMQTLVEGKVAQMNCLQSCRQRKVWEQMVLAVDRVAIQLAEQAKERDSQSNVATGEAPMQRVNFDEAEPKISQSDRASSFRFGSTTSFNPVYTNTTLITPTLVDPTTIETE